MGIDGIQDHPDAKANCSLCRGGGLLDTGESYGCILTPCICTGQADQLTWDNIRKHYPNANYLPENQVVDATIPTRQLLRRS